MHPKISIVSSIAECATLATLSLVQGVRYIGGIIADEDWQKITGPHGLVFVLIIGLLTLWIKSQRNDAATERRHREAMEAQREYADELKSLTVEQTKNSMRFMASIDNMDKNIQRLTIEIEDRMPPHPSKRNAA